MPTRIPKLPRTVDGSTSRCLPIHYFQAMPSGTMTPTLRGKRRTLFVASFYMLSSAAMAQLQEGYVPDFLQEMEEQEARRRQQSQRQLLRRSAQPQTEGGQFHRHLQANPEPPQLIWGYNPNPYDGPWPECEGKDAISCKDYIESWTGSNPNVAVEQRGSTDTFIRIVPTFFNYDPSRVWIHCDHRDQVVAPPKIG